MRFTQLPNCHQKYLTVSQTYFPDHKFHFSIRQCDAKVEIFLKLYIRSTTNEIAALIFRRVGTTILGKITYIALIYTVILPTSFEIKLAVLSKLKYYNICCLIPTCFDILEGNIILF